MENHWMDIEGFAEFSKEQELKRNKWNLLYRKIWRQHSKGQEQRKNIQNRWDARKEKRALQGEIKKTGQLNNNNGRL